MKILLNFLLMLLILVLFSCASPPSNDFLNSNFLKNQVKFSKIVNYFRSQSLMYVKIEDCFTEKCLKNFPNDIQQFLLSQRFLKIEYGAQNGNFSISLTAFRSRIFTSGREMGYFYTNVPELAGENLVKEPLKNGWFIFDIIN